MSSKFSTAARDLMNKETKEHPRRTHGLLGQSILSQFTLFRINNCELYLDLAEYKLPSSTLDLVNQVQAISDQVQEFPEGYDDWEDDDFAFEDDEYDVQE